MTTTWTPEQVARRRRRLVLGLIGVAAILILPSVGPMRSEYIALTVGIALCLGLVGLSVNVLTGYAGQISLGHAALWGTGAFATSHLMALRGVPFWLALPLGALVTGGVVLLVGFPALRVRGLNLAIVTLGFQFLMNRVVFRLQALTGGAAGIEVERPTLFGNELDLYREFVYVIIAVLVLVYLADRNLTRTKAGRAFLAIREDEQVASSFGIDVARYKLLAFVLSGIYAGLAGGLFGVLIGHVSVETYDYQPSLEFLAYAVIGGLGSRPGTMLASMFPTVFRQVLQSLRSWGIVLGGFLLVLTLVRYRGGLAEQGREIRHLLHLAWHHRRRIVRALPRLPVTIARALVTLVRLVPHLHHLPALVRARKAAKAAAAPAGPSDSIDVIELMARSAISTNGHAPSLGSRTRDERRVHRGPLLEIRDVSIRFGGVQALGGVSMEVREHEIVGIMGPNGAGKTTLFNCVSGFARPNSGVILLRGEDITQLGPHQRALLGLGRTFQNIGLVKSETVRANLLIAQHAVADYGPLEGILRTTSVQRTELRLQARATEVTRMLGLDPVLDRSIHDLPHGLLKVVELGAALVTDPEVLLLDEPSSGMSPPEAEQLGGTLQRIRDAFGVTIFLIDHHVPLILDVADFVYAMNFGTLLAEGATSEITSHPEVIAAYLGEADVEDEEPATAGTA